MSVSEVAELENKMNRFRPYCNKCHAFVASHAKEADEGFMRPLLKNAEEAATGWVTLVCDECDSVLLITRKIPVTG